MFHILGEERKKERIQNLRAIYLSNRVSHILAKSVCSRPNHLLQVKVQPERATLTFFLSHQRP